MSAGPYGQWQPIASAPKDGRWIILGSHTDCFMGFWSDLYREWQDQREATRDPTHWMPLPERPK